MAREFAVSVHYAREGLCPQGQTRRSIRTQKPTGSYFFNATRSSFTGPSAPASPPSSKRGPRAICHDIMPDLTWLLINKVTSLQGARCQPGMARIRGSQSCRLCCRFPLQSTAFDPAGCRCQRSKAQKNRQLAMIGCSLAPVWEQGVAGSNPAAPTTERSTVQRVARSVVFSLGVKSCRRVAVSPAGWRVREVFSVRT